MTYEYKSLSGLPLKYLIKEGFIEIKLVKITDECANLILDARNIINFPMKQDEINRLMKDVDFLNDYSKKDSDDD